MDQDDGAKERRACSCLNKLRIEEHGTLLLSCGEKNMEPCYSAKERRAQNSATKLRRGEYGELFLN